VFVLNNDIDVSVVIPTYNYSNFVTLAIDSALAQRGVILEVIVVDDGSIDDTKQVLSKYFGKIIYIYQENSGLPAARNTGLSVARGRYIQFLDSDDILGVDCLAKKFSYLESCVGKVVAVSRTVLFSRADSVDKIFRIGEWGLYENNLDVHLLRLNISSPNAFLFPREMVGDIGYFDQKMFGCDDYDYWLKALNNGYSFHACKTAIAFYRRHPLSMGARKSVKACYPYDVITHKRKFLHEYSVLDSTLFDDKAKLLALCDGILHTACLIDGNENRIGQCEMIEMAIFCLDRYISIHSTSTLYVLEWMLYGYRIISRSHKLDLLGSDLLSSKISDFKCCFDTLKNAVFAAAFSFPFNSYERKALISSLVKANIYKLKK
jgi:glycosyltransferase involved in cell wall biosynthesis